MAGYISIPTDSEGKVMQLVPDKAPLAVTYDATVSADTEVALNADTTLVEVTALNTPILIKYKTATGGTAVSTSNFSEIVAAGTTRQFKVPYIAGVRAAYWSFIEQAASATLIVIEK